MIPPRGNKSADKIKADFFRAVVWGGLGRLGAGTSPTNEGRHGNAVEPHPAEPLLLLKSAAIGPSADGEIRN